MKTFYYSFFLIPLFLLVDIEQSKSIECSSPIWRSTSQCLKKRTSPSLSKLRESKNTLGGADILNYLDNKPFYFKAKCGIPSKECNVAFTKGRLSIDNGLGINFEQFVSFITTRAYRKENKKFSLFKHYLESNYDYDFLIKYRDKSNNNRLALISFGSSSMSGNELSHQKFFKILTIWSEGLLNL